MFICKVTTTKVKLRFYKQCTVKPQHVLFTNKPFLRKMLESYFSSNISLCIEKNPVEKLCKILEIELKTHACVDLKLDYEKNKFKVLLYIKHDFIRQRPGLNKDQTSMFKILVIN